MDSPSVPQSDRTPHHELRPRRTGTRRASPYLAICLTLGALGLLSLVGISPARAASSLDGTISRSEVVQRASYWYGKGLAYGDWYSDPQGRSYRGDCSGYISMAWHLGTSRVTTPAANNLAEASARITEDQLRPGDLLMKSGIGGDGHAVLFEAWVDNTHAGYRAYEFTGIGVLHRTIAYPYDSDTSYQPYRYTRIQDDSPPAPAAAVRTLGDLTGDGRADIVTRDSTGILRLYRTTGSTTNQIVAPPAQIGTGWNGLDLWMADLTGDGRADIVTRDSTGILRLYRTTGSTTNQIVAPPVRIGVGWNGLDLYLGDLTGDGRADIVTRDSTGILRLYRTTGSTTADRIVASPVQIGTGWNGLDLL